MTIDHVFVNDLPYTDAEENPLESLISTLAFSADDWAASRAMAWTWGVVCGWDDGSYAELAPKCHWDAETVERNKRLHAAFEALRPGGDG